MGLVMDGRLLLTGLSHSDDHRTEQLATQAQQQRRLSV